MNKNIIKVAAVVMAASVLACTVIIVNGVRRYAWTVNADRNIHDAGVIVQTYRRDNGDSPKSLTEAFDWVDYPFKTNVAVLRGCPDSHYEYKIASNGFCITIVRTSAWFRSEWKVEQEFKFKSPTNEPAMPNRN